MYIPKFKPGDIVYYPATLSDSDEKYGIVKQEYLNSIGFPILWAWWGKTVEDCKRKKEENIQVLRAELTYNNLYLYKSKNAVRNLPSWF